MSIFANGSIHKRSEKGVGDTRKPSGESNLHHGISHCKHGPAFFTGISQADYSSLDFGAVQKDFTVSEEVCPPTLAPVFLPVSL